MAKTAGTGSHVRGEAWDCTAVSTLPRSCLSVPGAAEDGGGGIPPTDCREPRPRHAQKRGDGIAAVSPMEGFLHNVSED